jgi:hypothetical protein
MVTVSSFNAGAATFAESEGWSSFLDSLLLQDVAKAAVMIAADRSFAQFMERLFI